MTPNGTVFGSAGNPPVYTRHYPQGRGPAPRQGCLRRDVRARRGAVAARGSRGRGRSSSAGAALRAALLFVGCAEEGRADAAAEVPQSRHVHGGWILVGEQVRMHRPADPLDVWFPEAADEAAADDDRLEVHEVDRRGDARAQRLDGAVNQLLRQRVVGLDRARPDSACEPVAIALLHDLEEVCLGALLVPLSRLDFHRRAPGVCLHAATASAGTASAVLLHDHVADLASGAAAVPGLAVQDDAAADAGAPEDADQGVVVAAGAQLRLGLGGHTDVVSHRNRRAKGVREPLAELERATPAGKILGLRYGARLLVDVAGRSDPGACQLARLHAGVLGRLAKRLRHLLGHVLRLALRWGRPAGLADDVPLAVHDDGLDLDAAEVDSTSQHRLSGTHAIISFARLLVR